MYVIQNEIWKCHLAVSVVLSNVQEASFRAVTRSSPKSVPNSVPKRKFAKLKKKKRIMQWYLGYEMIFPE